MNLQNCISSSVTNDSKNSVEEFYKVFEVMDVADVEFVELVPY